MNSREVSIGSKVLVAAATAAALGLTIFLVSSRRRPSGPSASTKTALSWLRTRVMLQHKQLLVVNSRDECARAIGIILRECQFHRYVGFDCEWQPQTSRGQRKRPVALLQLASPQGSCVLLRLCQIGFVPEEVKALLGDPFLLKVGVAPLDDAGLLLKDYGAQVRGCLDVRHFLSPDYFEPSELFHTPGLARMAQDILGVTMNKDWHIRGSNWEAETLSSEQVEYAANDVLVSALLFARLTGLNTPWWPPWRAQNKRPSWNEVWNLCTPVVDTIYRSKPKKGMQSKKPTSQAPAPQAPTKQTPTPTFKQSSRAYFVRSKCLYDNCVLLAPDGEELCTCERKKALWYVKRELGEILEDGERLVVKLNFEPAGRYSKIDPEVHKYYTTLKENICVVCGADHSFTKRNIVPHEYRTHFPESMKSHHSHDVLLLCQLCALQAVHEAQHLRDTLATSCNAPTNVQQFMLHIPLLKVQSAAKALLNKTHTLPKARVEKLTSTIAEHYQLSDSEITSDMIWEASNVDIKIQNFEYASQAHGFRVVRYYQDQYGEKEGIRQLEKLWRTHFLDTMTPRFLPKLWSINHRHN